MSFNIPELKSAILGTDKTITLEQAYRRTDTFMKSKKTWSDGPRFHLAGKKWGRDFKVLDNARYTFAVAAIALLGTAIFAGFAVVLHYTDYSSPSILFYIVGAGFAAFGIGKIIYDKTKAHFLLKKTPDLNENAVQEIVQEIEGLINSRGPKTIQMENLNLEEK